MGVVPVGVSAAEGLDTGFEVRSSGSRDSEGGRGDSVGVDVSPDAEVGTDEIFVTVEEGDLEVEASE